MLRFSQLIEARCWGDGTNGEMGINRGRVISKFNKSKILDNRVTIIGNYGEMKQNLEELEKASKRNFLTPCPEVKAVSFS